MVTCKGIAGFADRYRINKAKPRLTRRHWMDTLRTVRRRRRRKRRSLQEVQHCTALYSPHRQGSKRGKSRSPQESSSSFRMVIKGQVECTCSVPGHQSLQFSNMAT
ncbi:uncharacterized [Tachysurus ichikawai]